MNKPDTSVEAKIKAGVLTEMKPNDYNPRENYFVGVLTIFALLGLAVIAFIAGAIIF